LGYIIKIRNDSEKENDFLKLGAGVYFIGHIGIN
jgi:hypothetical protein